MSTNNIIELDEFIPKTSKLISLKLAKKLGLTIPETLVVENIFKINQGQINDFTLKGWFLRECATDKMFGEEIPISKTNHIKELFFQELISSEFSGNVWNYNENIYIESIIGNGYGLNRMGFTPTTYYNSFNKIKAIKQNHKYEIDKGEASLKKCGKYSKLPKSVIEKLIEITKLFPNEIIEWAYSNKKLYFLESYAYPTVTKHSISGYLVKNSNIIFLPRAELSMWPLCKDKEAIIVKEGGYSSHLAILCGIFRKPFVRYPYSIPKNKKVRIKYSKLIF